MLLVPASAFGAGAISCEISGNRIVCAGAANFPSPAFAFKAAMDACLRNLGRPCRLPWLFSNTCQVVYASPNTFYSENSPTRDEGENPRQACLNNPEGARPCLRAMVLCDGTASRDPTPNRVVLFSYPPPSRSQNFALFSFGAVGTGISFGIGLVIVLLIYASRARLINLIIHGNLPQKIPVYAEDIQVLFKRTQRVNWYGRVVFGIIARLAMDHKQLSLVRRYWLGRVIAFDSLRRQRQNRLARIHLQLAASVKPESNDKKPLSQLWAAIKYLFLVLFYVVRALFSFLFGFFFIRVTIAKLVSGELIESKDLVLVLQAKEAIEESARYLKEYLTTAETFDEREELFESK
jgi:hypothetical protein